jgi:hypothetical protein
VRQLRAVELARLQHAKQQQANIASTPRAYGHTPGAAGTPFRGGGASTPRRAAGTPYLTPATPAGFLWGGAENAPPPPPGAQPLDFGGALPQPGLFTPPPAASLYDRFGRQF